jgi:hypothetical protein
VGIRTVAQQQSRAEVGIVQQNIISKFYLDIIFVRILSNLSLYPGFILLLLHLEYRDLKREKSQNPRSKLAMSDKNVSMKSVLDRLKLGNLEDETFLRVKIERRVLMMQECRRIRGRK